MSITNDSIQKVLPPLVQQARDFAERAHDDQMYAEHRYVKHLDDVDAVLTRFIFYGNVELRAAAYLHDVVEDTRFSLIDLMEHGFSAYTVALVDAVTDAPGLPRADRKRHSYPRIARIPEAIVLKLADRIANVQACIEIPDARRLKMYAEEQREFHAWLCDQSPGAPTSIVAMWDHLYYLIRVEAQQVPNAR